VYPRHGPVVRITTAAEAAAADAAAIAAGTPSRALMQRAGAVAASEIVRRYGRRLARGVAVHAGPGNNGGDAWVVAAALARAGVQVGVREWAGVPRTDDARFERARAADAVGPVTGREAVVIDGLFGTGGRARDPELLAAFAAEVAAARAAGARVVALDVPSGLDATTGQPLGAVAAADLTLTFGTLKRGLLVGRGLAGAIAVLDIGLESAHEPAGAPLLVTAPGAPPLGDAVPAIGADAHKGTRGRVAVIGGAPGMVGAAVLASAAALRSGAGMARAVVAPESVPAVQHALPAALASPWPEDDDTLAATVLEWADAVLVGPGLGRSDPAASLCDRLLRAWRGPVVLDADALNHFAGRAELLAPLLEGRPALLTPHPLECARLTGLTVDEVLAQRFDVGAALAARTGAAVLLKGVPTVVSGGGERLVVARGTPALATGGSGDVLGGIAAALLAPRPSGQASDDGAAADVRRAARAGAAAAWIHGRAAERATAARGGVRGTTLDDVLAAVGETWPRDGIREPAPYPVLAELPRVPS
jgi:NAD(P)H-hydrate epimerase